MYYEAMKTYPEHFNIYKAFKAYVPDRTTEVFRMIQSGAYSLMDCGLKR
ncbi:MAG: hypothetical protein IPO92_19045 [Saprospiraceae bacterium]|nr:hypothetical protein [Saprospiraceae bacterium]